MERLVTTSSNATSGNSPVVGYRQPLAWLSTLFSLGLIGIFLGVAIGIVAHINSSPIYESNAMLKFKPGSAYRAVAGERKSMAGLNPGSSHAILLTSNDLIEGCIEKHNLKSIEYFRDFADDDISESIALNLFAKGAPNSSEVVILRYRSNDPIHCEMFLNQLIGSYVDKLNNEIFDELAELRNEISGRRQELESGLKDLFRQIAMLDAQQEKNISVGIRHLNAAIYEEKSQLSRLIHFKKMVAHVNKNHDPPQLEELVWLLAQEGQLNINSSLEAKPLEILQRYQQLCDLRIKQHSERIEANAKELSELLVLADKSAKIESQRRMLDTKSMEIDRQLFLIGEKQSRLDLQSSASMTRTGFKAVQLRPVKLGERVWPFRYPLFLLGGLAGLAAGIAIGTLVITIRRSYQTVEQQTE